MYHLLCQLFGRKFGESRVIKGAKPKWRDRAKGWVKGVKTLNKGKFWQKRALPKRVDRTVLQAHIPQVMHQEMVVNNWKLSSLPKRLQRSRRLQQIERGGKTTQTFKPAHQSEQLFYRHTNDK